MLKSLSKSFPIKLHYEELYNKSLKGPGGKKTWNCMTEPNQKKGGKTMCDEPPNRAKYRI